MTITICSSIEFTPDIEKVKHVLEAAGHLVHIPYCAQKILNGDMSLEEFLRTKKEKGSDMVFRDAEPVDFIQRYWNLIQESDAILVLNMTKNGIENYIGGSVLMEMGFAYGHGKKIFLYNPIPTHSERMHYVDEITAMKPIVIHGDIHRIQ